MRKFAIVFVALALSGCGGGVPGGAGTLEDSLVDAADFFNTRGDSFLPVEMGGATVSARVEGKDTIVVRMVNIPTGHATFDPNYARKMMRPKLCETSSSRKIIERGGRIWLEMQSNIGKELPSFGVARC